MNIGLSPPSQCKEIIRGGSGYCIIQDGNQEIYNHDNDMELPPEIEHIYPDYSLYSNLTEDTAFGFLTGYDTTLEQDLERIYTLRELGYDPYVMIYDKEHVKRGTDLRRLQRWVNSKVTFAAVKKI